MDNKEFYSLLQKRRSIRNYRSGAVEHAVLERLGRAVELSPSACNKQPCRMIVVTNAALLDALRAACPQQMLKKAPAIACVVGNPDAAWHRPEGDSIIPVDAAIMMDHLILAATAEGLGTCWVCAYNMKKVGEALGVDPGCRVYAVTPLGYPSEPAAPIVRKKLTEVFEIVE